MQLAFPSTLIVSGRHICGICARIATPFASLPPTLLLLDAMRVIQDTAGVLSQKDSAFLSRRSTTSFSRAICWRRTPAPSPSEMEMPSYDTSFFTMSGGHSTRHTNGSRLELRGSHTPPARIKRCITLDQCYCCLVHQLVYGMIGAARGLVFGRFAL